MTATVAGLLVALIAAALDLALPAGPAPRGWRRLLRALPAGVLAVALRLAGAPPLPAAALLAFAVADALALDGGERGVGVWTVSLLAVLLLAAAVWELASPALLGRAPWRTLGGVVVLGGGFAILRARPARGELKALAPLAPVLLTVTAVGAGAQSFPVLALGFGAAVAFWTLAALAEAWRRGTTQGLPRLERALRSAAPLAFAWPLLPLPR